MRSVPLLVFSVAIASACMPDRQVTQEARAESPAPRPTAGSVLDAADVVRRVAPHGKAHVTELAAGTEAWLGILELAPDVAVPEHRDPTEETIHVLEGTGTITMKSVAPWFSGSPWSSLNPNIAWKVLNTPGGQDRHS